MTTYPDVIEDVRATLPLTRSEDQPSLITEFGTGIEARRLMRSSVRRTVDLSYSILTFEKANTLRQFYRNMQGSYKAFSFFFPQIEPYIKELVGVTTQNITSISLPSKNAQTYTLYRDNVALSLGTEWSFAPSGGGDGEDRADLNFIPNIGDIYHFTFTGRLRITARFKQNGLAFDDIKAYWSSAKVSIIGLEPDLYVSIE